LVDSPDPVLDHVALGFQADAERLLEVVHLLLGGLLRLLDLLLLLGGLRGGLLLRLLAFSPTDQHTRGSAVSRTLAGVVAGDLTNESARRRSFDGARCRPCRRRGLPLSRRLLSLGPPAVVPASAAGTGPRPCW
jgi:hypothetical protein